LGEIQEGIELEIKLLERIEERLESKFRKQKYIKKRGKSSKEVEKDFGMIEESRFYVH
jgi:hypothetical protein